MTGFKWNEIDWFAIGVLAVKPLITIIVWYIADILLRKLHRRTQFIDKVVTKSVSSHEEKQAIAQRAATFRALFVQMVRILNAIFFIFILLETFGVDPKPLLAGVGVVGLGLSLAAQNILRDFLSGIFILIEDQYNVGDYIDINGTFGCVETFTMRATKLRKLDGSLVTVPNGTIGQVINSSKDWSVAIVTVGLPFGTDLEAATGAIKRSCARLREEKPDVVKDDGNVQGIVEFRASDMLMRVLVKTLPGEQWGVERALRALIVEALPEAGVEAPIQHVVNHISRQPAWEAARPKP